MQSCNLMLTASFIVTQNDGRDIIRNGAIAIQGENIAAIGPAEEIEKEWQAGERRDLGAALLIPGLVNAHTHAPMTLLRGMADDIPLMEWLNHEIFPREARLTPRMLEVGTALACAEMLRTGTTVFCDMYLNETYVYRTADKTGIRALVGEGIFAFPSIGYADPTKVLDIARKQAEELAGNQRTRYAIMPHAVYTTNMDILENCAKLADDLNLPVHVHLAETVTETAQSIEMYGCRPVEVCRRAGLLGPKTSIAHGVDLNDEEIELLAECGVSVAHNPRSNMKLSSGISPVSAMLSKGVNVALGTDGAASNNRLNMFSDMSACALLHKCVSKEPTSMPAQTVLDMATINGAKALCWPGLGSLKPGAPADIVALDITHPNLVPMSSPVSHLVYATGGNEVIMTMVAGKTLYDKGHFTTIDYPALIEEAQELHNILRMQD